MKPRSPAKIACRWLVRGVIVAALLAPALAAFLDLGPTGRARASLFPFLLTLSDGAAVASLANSVIVAAIVAALASVIGVALGRVAASRKFFGRDALISLASVPSAYPPLFAAVGVLGVRGGAWPPGSVGPWLAFAAIELAWSVPRVMRAAAGGFARVAPSALDAARLAGAGRWRAWWGTAWPMARRPVAVAAAEVFGLVLFEPGAPLALDLDRTLASAIVRAALGLDGAARAASLGVLGLLAIFAARGLMLRLGGRPIASDLNSLPQRLRRPGSLAILGLVLWAGLALLPTLAVFASALGLTASGRVRFDFLIGLGRDPRSAGGAGARLSAGAGGDRVRGAGGGGSGTGEGPGAMARPGVVAVGGPAGAVRPGVHAPARLAGRGGGGLAERCSLHGRAAPPSRRRARSVPPPLDRADRRHGRLAVARDAVGALAGARVGARLARRGADVGGVAARGVADRSVADALGRGGGDRGGLGLGLGAGLGPRAPAHADLRGAADLAESPRVRQSDPRRASALAAAALALPFAAWVVGGNSRLRLRRTRERDRA